MLSDELGLRLCPEIFSVYEKRGYCLFIFFFTSMNAADNLCKASARGNLPEVLLLLQNGADVNGFNRYNRTALQVGMKCF